MTFDVFILVPSPHPTGPVKGAIALANALVAVCNVSLVYLKEGPGADAEVDTRIAVISLAKTGRTWIRKFLAYRALLKASGGRSRTYSISMCLSADMVNSRCRDLAVICASVRGNLPENYRHEYGVQGLVLSVVHMWLLRSFDHVVAMTQAMADQLQRLAFLKPKVIGNFIDEMALEPYRGVHSCNGGPRLVFVGSLTSRKQPLVLLSAFAKVREFYPKATLDILGEGPLRPKVEAFIVAENLSDHVRLRGQVENPYPVLASADLFVLPSKSEGVSRAAMEALFLGVPCVLRDVDGNGELLGVDGPSATFRSDDELPVVICRLLDDRQDLVGRRGPLLPATFRQQTSARRYLDLMENAK